MTWNQVESQVFSNIAANTAGFTLRGGLYGVKATATFSAGSVTLQVLADDGSTWLTAMTAFSAAGYASAYLPAGTYRFGVTTATAVYCSVTGIATTQ
jgi:hypothetical protein